MSDPRTLAMGAVQAFGQRDYLLCAQLAAQGFPRVTVTTIHVFLISLQRLGREDLVHKFEAEHLHTLAAYPVEQAMVMMTMGLKEPPDVRALVTDAEQLAEFYCYLGSRYLTRDQVELAREQFQLCDQVPGSFVEKVLARWQASWPSQEPRALRRSMEELAAATSKLDRLREEGRPEEALSAAAACFEEFQGNLRISIRNHLTIINNYAACQYELGHLDDAAALCNLAVDVREKAVVAECFETSVTLSLIGMISRRKGHNEEAVEYFDRALAEKKRSLGETAPATIVAVVNIVRLLAELHRYESASRYFLQAVTALEQDSEHVAASLLSELDNLGYRLLEHWAPIREDSAFARYARRRGEQAGAMLREADTSGAISSSDLPWVASAAELAIRADTRPESEAHPATRELRGFLARAYRTAGDPVAALRHLRAVVAEFDEGTSAAMPEANALFQLGATLMEVRQFDEARNVFERALKIVRSSTEPISDNSVKLMNAAGVALTYVDPAKAEAIFLEASDLLARHLGGRHDLELLLDLNRAGCLVAQRKFSEVRTLLARLDEPVLQTAGHKSLQHLVILTLRGESCVAEGAFEEAEVASSFVVDNPIPFSRNYTRLRARALLALAHARAVLGRHASALQALLETHEFKSGEFEQVALVATDLERRRYYRQLSHELSILLTILDAAGTVSSDLALRLWQFMVRCKAMGPEILALRRSRTAFGNSDSALRDELRTLRQRAAALEMSGPPIDDEGANAFMTNLYDLRVQIANHEKQLSNSDMFRRKVMRTIFVDAERLLSTVEDDTAFVEIIKYSKTPFERLFHPADERESHAYLAFLVSGRSKTVTVVPFGDAEPIDAAAQKIRQSVQGERSLDELEIAALDSLRKAPAQEEDPHITLYKAIVQPLLSAVARDVRKLVIAPAGELCRLPLGALMNPDGEYLMDRFVISYLPSGRALLEDDVGSTAASAPIVFASPDYEWDGNPGKLERGGDEHPDSVLEPDAVSAPASSSDDIQFRPLPATTREAQAVARILNVQPLTGRSALKATALSVQSPLVLHFASHGYFLKSEAPEGLGVALDLPVEVVVAIAPEHAIDGRLSLRIQNPLLRSGIALAGANAWLKGRPTSADVSDGLLSAEDIAGIDLSGTQLVVLSGCDTGLGDIRLGEGILGLQQSFTIAGARTLIMSLWKVPDVVTRMLMEKFYSNVLQHDQKIDEALHDAQLFVRTITVRDLMVRSSETENVNDAPPEGLEWLSSHDKSSCPFVNEAYWGGFICVGAVDPFSSRVVRAS